MIVINSPAWGDDIRLDGVARYVDDSPADVTEHPISRRADATDHVQIRRRVVRISALVSSQGLGDGSDALDRPPGADQATELIEILRFIRDKSEFCTLAIPDEPLLRDVLLGRVDVARDDSGLWQVSLDAYPVTRIRVGVADVPPLTAPKPSVRNAAAQEADKGSTTTRRRTLARAALDALRGGG
jgi:hypothetical protein